MSPEIKCFRCYVFGCPFDDIYIRTTSAKKARDLASFRLRAPRHMVIVKYYPDIQPNTVPVSI